MGKLIRPSHNKYKGPWLVDKKALEELHGSLGIIETILDKAYEIEVESKAKLNLAEYQNRDPKIDLSKAKIKVRKSYAFEESEKKMVLWFKESIQVEDSSLLTLLKDPQIITLHPKGIVIKIEKGPCKFELELNTKYEGELETEINGVNDKIFNAITYEINKWIENHKSNLAIQKWSSLFPWAAYPILILLIITTLILLPTRNTVYEAQLLNEGQELLQDGITQDETTKALEIIIQKEIGYVPADFNPNTEINSTFINIWLIVGIGIIILLIKPKSIIGLGKNAWKIKFYKYWTYLVLIYIPVSIILPYLKSKFM